MYKVLLVEDEDIIREGLRYMVDWLSVDCVVIGEAANGIEGIDKIKEDPPDIVLLDVNMPIKNGIEMLDEVNGTYTFSTIILSGYNEFEYAKKAIEHEVIDYLLKPVDHEKLYQAVEKAKKVINLKSTYHYFQTKMVNPSDLQVLNKDLLLTEHETTPQVRKVIQYVEEHYSEKISINDLVDQIGYSATYLNKKFKEETTYTFNDFLNRFRVQKAIQLISTGEEKISMVALDVGYSNYQYFIKVFKKYTNLLPSDFVMQ